LKAQNLQETLIIKRNLLRRAQSQKHKPVCFQFDPGKKQKYRLSPERKVKFPVKFRSVCCDFIQKKLQLRIVLRFDKAPQVFPFRSG